MYKIHKWCYDIFNESYFDKNLKSKKRKKGDAILQTTRMSMSIHSKICWVMYILWKAGHRWPEALKKSNLLHPVSGFKASKACVDEFTTTMREMATKLEDEF